LIDSSARARKPERLEALPGTSVEGALPCLEKHVKQNLEKISRGALRLKEQVRQDAVSVQQVPELERTSGAFPG